MSRFDDFIRERKYLYNVSPATVRWYVHAFKWLPSESPTQAELKNMVVRMREAGLKETGANAAIRAINAYLHWNGGSERKCGAGCTHPRVHQLKEPQNVLPTFTDEQVKRIVNWRPRAKNFYDRRLHLLALLLLDTGARISEALGLRVSDVDLDNMLLVLNGKGRKQRIVPFSFLLRKALHRFIADFLKPHSLLFATQVGVQVRRMTALRSIKLLCEKLGFDPPGRTLHSFRHCFAANYTRRGGSVFHLQKMLGHTSLEMSRRYASLTTEDLQAAHERLTLLR
jgi:integrase/recombinase XerD